MIERPSASPAAPSITVTSQVRPATSSVTGRSPSKRKSFSPSSAAAASSSSAFSAATDGGGGDMVGKLAAPVAFFFLQQYLCALFSSLVVRRSVVEDGAPAADLAPSWDLIRTWLPLPALDSSAPVLYCVLAFFHLMRYKDHRKIGRAISHGLKVLLLFLVLCSEFQFLTVRSVGVAATKKLGFPYFRLSMDALPFSAYGVLFTLVALLLKEYEKFEVDGVLWYLIAMFGTASSGHSDTVEVVRSCILTVLVFKFFVATDAAPPPPPSPDAFQKVKGIRYPLTKAEQRQQQQQRFSQKVDARVTREEDSVEYDNGSATSRSQRAARRVRKRMSSSVQVATSAQQGAASSGDASEFDADYKKDEPQFEARRRTEIPSGSSKPMLAVLAASTSAVPSRPDSNRARVEQGRLDAQLEDDTRRRLDACREAYLDLMRDHLTLAPYRDGVLFVLDRDGTLQLGGAYDEDCREKGIDFPEMAHARFGRLGLEKVQECLLAIISEGVPGNILDTRPWRGGFGIFCRSVLRIYQDTERLVGLINVRRHRLPRFAFVFYLLSMLPGFVTHALLTLIAYIPVIGVSLPKMDSRDDRARFIQRLSFYFRNSDLHHKAHVEGTALRHVESVFERYGFDLKDGPSKDLQLFLSDDAIGSWKHQQTVVELAMLRVGGASARKALDAYYDKVSPGGFIFVDEYDLPGGCQKDISTFLREKNLNPRLHAVAGHRVYWKKPDDSQMLS